MISIRHLGNPRFQRRSPLPRLSSKPGEAVGFLSREAKVIPASVTPTSPRQQRRRRTGRNAQFNIKTKPETIEAFVAIADAQGWGIGEAFEIATDLLQRKYRAS